MSRSRPRFVPSSRWTDASSTRTRSSSKSGPMNRARTSFTGIPPHNSLKEGTTIASLGSFGYRLCFRRNGTRIQHGTICRDPIASRNAAAGWLCPMSRTDPSMTFLYGQACPWQNPTSSIRKPYAGLKRTLRGTMFFSMPSWFPWAMYTSRNLGARSRKNTYTSRRSREAIFGTRCFTSPRMTSRVAPRRSASSISFRPITSARLGTRIPFSCNSSSIPMCRSATTSMSSARRAGSSGIGSRSTSAPRAGLANGCAGSATLRGSEKFREDPAEVLGDVDGGQSVTLDLEGEVPGIPVRKGAQPGRIERRHAFRHEAGHNPTQDVARPADRHPGIPGVVELHPRPIRHDVHMAFEEDRGAERLRRFPEDLGAFFGSVWEHLPRQGLELSGMGGDDRAFSDEALRIRGDRSDRVCIHYQRQRDAADDFRHGVQGPFGVAQSGADRDRVRARGQVDDLPCVLPQEPMSDEGMHDEHRGVRCDDGGRESRRRDMDEICADSEGAVSDQRRRAGVRPAGNHEDATVLTLVARRPRDRVEREFAGPDHRGDFRGDADVRDADSSGVLGAHPLLHVVERDRDRRSDGLVRPEPARDVYAQDWLAGGVHLADQRRVRLAKRAFRTDPEECVDQQVCRRDGLLASVEARQDLHVPQSFEVRRRLRGRELIGRSREEDRNPRVRRQVTGGHEAIPAVVSGATEDEDILSRRTELGPRDIGRGFPGVLHELHDRDAEVLGVPIEDAHLSGRNHRARIRSTLVKRCPRS